MGDTTGVLDLVLISLFALFVWFVNNAANRAGEAETPQKETPKGGKKFLWRFRVGEEKMEMKVWRIHDSV